MAEYLLAIWTVAALLLALLLRSGRAVYWTAVGLAAIPVYFRQRHGNYLPMLGALHVLSMGMFALVLYWVVQRVRER